MSHRLRRRPDMSQLERGLRIGVHLAQGGAVTAKWLQEQFNCSWPTSKRDMVTIETTLWADCQLGEQRAKVLRLPGKRR